MMRAHSIPEGQLIVRIGNLYELDFEAESWLLKQGGLLHVYAPNAHHPYNASVPLDPDEAGGHVRPGCSLEDYCNLPKPIGFEIDTIQGLGGPVRQAFNRQIKDFQARYGAAAGIPIFLLSLPCLWFENRVQEKRNPFSIYVRAVKLPRP